MHASAKLSNIEQTWNLKDIQMEATQSVAPDSIRAALTA
jgi:hypothetical protein